MNKLDISIKNKIKPQRGRLLLSEPFLVDDFFSRSVVMLCENGPEGSFGFVLNNYTDISFSDINPNFPNISLKISLGGPVKPEHLYFIHTLDNEEFGGQKIQDEIFLGGNFEKVLSLIQEDRSILEQIRFFLGYSGWTSGQLEDEIEEKSWLVIPMPEPAYIMDTARENIWNDMMQSQGGIYKLMSKFPLDPRMN